MKSIGRPNHPPRKEGPVMAKGEAPKWEPEKEHQARIYAWNTVKPYLSIIISSVLGCMASILICLIFYN